MKANNELSKVQPLLDRWHEHKGPQHALQARAILVDMREELVDAALRDARALTADEGRAFDEVNVLGFDRQTVRV